MSGHPLGPAIKPIQPRIARFFSRSSSAREEGSRLNMIATGAEALGPVFPTSVMTWRRHREIGGPKTTCRKFSASLLAKCCPTSKSVTVAANATLPRQKLSSTATWQLDGSVRRSSVSITSSSICLCLSRNPVSAASTGVSEPSTSPPSTSISKSWIVSGPLLPPNSGKLLLREGRIFPRSNLEATEN